MSELVDILRATLLGGVEGQGAHTDASRMLDGLDWQLAGRRLADAPYTIQQEANHIIYWNGYSLAAAHGENPTPPEHDVDGWPGPAAPASAADWEAFVGAYKASLAALATEIGRADLGGMMPSGRRTRTDVLRAMGNHVSYHVGQIALLRRMLGAWPPPGGGDTW
jgi:uncharacterized damage-inducible protein DinB